jgi:hypothetical protein
MFIMAHNLNISHLSPTAEAGVRYQASICGNCREQSDSERVVSENYSALPRQYYSTSGPYSFIYHWHYTMVAIHTASH